MSEYTIVQCEYADAECVKLALKELGYAFTEHEVAQQLYGYENSARHQTAHIIINRKNVGSAANDVGFKRNADGKYELIISEYDRSGKKKQAVDFMERMKQIYAKHKTLKQLKKMGKRITSVKTLADGRIKIKALG